MKKILFTFSVFLICISAFAQVGIGTTNPSEASMLEISSTADEGKTFKGLMPPRLPNIEARSSIKPTADDTGLMVYVKSIGCLQMWNGTDWEDIKCQEKPVVSKLAFWDFAGNKGSEPSVTPIDKLIGISSGIIERGSGISPTANIGTFHSNNFAQLTEASAVANNDFIQFSITPDTGKRITVTSVFFIFERSNTGPTSAVLRSNVDSFTANLATYSGLADNTPITVDISGSGIADQTNTVTFRLYLFDNSNLGGTAGFGGNGQDLSITGSIR